MRDSKKRPLIVVLSGPTAVGKTEIALKLAKDFGMEIVNADSMQVYRLLDIGTAKPTVEERSLVVHHLIDIVNPDEPFDAGTYQERADEVIGHLWSSGIIPLIVGGTGLYIRALTRGLCKTPENDLSKKEAIRHELKRRLREEGREKLYEELKRLDPELALTLHPSDSQRIMRGLEIFMLTGIPLSLFQKEHRFSEERYSAIKIFIYRDKEELIRRINQRVFNMIELGLCEEVKNILELGYSPYLKPLQSIGYRQIISHLEGRIGLDEAIREIQRETRHYAKRQFTWFRKEPGFRWFFASEEDKLWRFVEEAIK
ncbi:MAG: tRNA (adenosine(37)-N6)-dimethylallyltransferase MiaA [Syntrophobacterales bacterium]|nr:tRNA (adenosine(37)-N6)-dimethylallyltransferase MiaA [Syntrophobacterales bacterium]